jgi:hypothetical protein
VPPIKPRLLIQKTTARLPRCSPNAECRQAANNRSTALKATGRIAVELQHLPAGRQKLLLFVWFQER